MKYLLPVILLFLNFLEPATSAASGCDAKCTFSAGNLTSATIGSFPTTCAKICTTRIIISNNTGLTEQQLTNAFKNMKTLVGGLEIWNTDFSSLKFLANLERIESGMEFITIKENQKLVELGLSSLTTIIGVDFSVYQNYKMTRLNLPKLKTISIDGVVIKGDFPYPPRGTYIQIETNHPTDFCATADEMRVFLSRKTNVPFVGGKVCPPAKFTPKICKTPAETCVELFGDLNIGPKFAVKNVKNLKILYGSLIMKNTNFTDFKFLKNLTHIVQSNDNKVTMNVQGNKKLTSMAFPKLQLVMCETFDWGTFRPKEAVVFKNNHASLLRDVESCYALAEAFRDHDMANPTVNGMMCYELAAKFPPTTKKATPKKGTTKKGTTKKGTTKKTTTKKPSGK